MVRRWNIALRVAASGNNVTLETGIAAADQNQASVC